jgi:hypothetical protein
MMTKHRKMIKKCPHLSTAPYYANGMCKNCYHNHGRKKLAFNCPHSERLLYAKGNCKSCYLKKYVRKSKAEYMGIKFECKLEEFEEY